MLQLDIAAILNEREIEKHNLFLINNGFSPFIASRLLNNKTKGIQFKHLEKLCLILRCTPNNLFVWKTNNASTQDENQPVTNLLPTKHKQPINYKFKNLPLEKLRELKKEMEEAIKTIS